MEHLGDPKSTACRWTLEGEKLDRRGGGRYKKNFYQYRDYFVEEIEANCRGTVSDLKKGLFERFNVTVSTETIRLHPDALLYTLKDIR